MVDVILIITISKTVHKNDKQKVKLFQLHPFELLPDLQDNKTLQHIKEFGHPAQSLNITLLCLFFTWVRMTFKLIIMPHSTSNTVKSLIKSNMRTTGRGWN